MKNRIDQRSILNSSIGIVKDTDDPAQMGRVRIFIPSIDHENYKIEDLPWAIYATPFGGSVENMKRGPEGDTTSGPSSYGFWSIPKRGAQVIVQFLSGDSSYRIYTNCIFPIHTNRSLPGGRNKDPQDVNGPFSDSYDDYQPVNKNLKTAGLSEGTHYDTRGYERQVAQASNEKDGKEGYAPDNNKQEGKDPQTYSWTSPGGHYISMQDQPEFCRTRIKTVSGNQIILDDTNERIYISTAKGNSWIELDQDGHIHMFSSESVSITSKKDMNFNASNINLDASSDINIHAGNNINIESGTDINLKSGASILETSSAIEMNASGNIIQTGAKIHLNGPGAKHAISSKRPIIIPAHEPWNRPKSSSTRNKNWKA